jgi:hypothetical protein
VIGGIIIVAIFGRFIDESLAQGLVAREIGVQNFDQFRWGNFAIVVIEAKFLQGGETIG